jgi:hypothetical protein
MADKLGDIEGLDPTRPRPQQIPSPAISPLDALFMGDIEEETDQELADTLEDDSVEDGDLGDLEEDEV